MEKVCEFCLALRPVVYCQADAAHLCLSCDAKVHSANALSHRHLRTLLCNSCWCRPAYTHCLDHRMYVCHICDRNLHNGPSQHRKQILNSYMGCPSANELATMWNVELSGLSSTARSDELVSSASYSVNIVSSSANRQSTKVSRKGRQQQSSCLILQQILDLRRLQSGERNNCLNMSKSCLTREDTGPDMHTHLDHSTKRDVCEETYPSPFSQLASLPSSSIAMTSLPGETFWQSPQTNQFWSQNMEDIGLCEELFHGTDLDIPDIDMTFHNFEEAFRGEEDSIKETRCSFANINTSVATSDDGHENAASRLSSESISVDSDPLPSNAGGDGLSVDKVVDHGRHDKRTQTVPRRGRTAARKRVKGTSSKLEGYNSDHAGVARSY